jgi:hypothetical protein
MDSFKAMLLSGIGHTVRFLAHLRGREAVLVVAVLSAFVLLLLLSHPSLGGWAMALEPGPARP